MNAGTLIFTRRGRCLIHHPYAAASQAVAGFQTPFVRPRAVCTLLVSLYDMFVHRTRRHAKPAASDDAAATSGSGLEGGAVLSLGGFDIVIWKGRYVHAAILTQLPGASASTASDAATSGRELAIWSLRMKARQIVHAFEIIHRSAMVSLRAVEDRELDRVIHDDDANKQMKVDIDSGVETDATYVDFERRVIRTVHELTTYDITWFTELSALAASGGGGGGGAGGGIIRFYLVQLPATASTASGELHARVAYQSALAVSPADIPVGPSNAGLWRTTLAFARAAIAIAAATPIVVDFSASLPVAVFVQPIAIPNFCLVVFARTPRAGASENGGAVFQSRFARPLAADEKRAPAAAAAAAAAAAPAAGGMDSGDTMETAQFARSLVPPYRVLSDRSGIEAVSDSCRAVFRTLLVTTASIASVYPDAHPTPTVDALYAAMNRQSPKSLSSAVVITPNSTNSANDPSTPAATPPVAYDQPMAGPRGSNSSHASGNSGVGAAGAGAAGAGAGGGGGGATIERVFSSFNNHWNDNLIASAATATSASTASVASSVSAPNSATAATTATGPSPTSSGDPVSPPQPSIRTIPVFTPSAAAAAPDPSPAAARTPVALSQPDAEVLPGAPVDAAASRPAPIIRRPKPQASTPAAPVAVAVTTPALAAEIVVPTAATTVNTASPVVPSVPFKPRPPPPSLTKPSAGTAARLPLISGFASAAAAATASVDSPPPTNGGATSRVDATPIAAPESGGKVKLQSRMKKDKPSYQLNLAAVAMNSILSGDASVGGDDDAPRESRGRERPNRRPDPDMGES